MEDLSKLIVRVRSDPTNYRNPQNKVLIRKLNTTLIAIVKQDWTADWTDFVNQMCTSALTNETLCENNLILLRLLSEDIFDFGKDTMTEAKRISLKQRYHENFSQVFNLCLQIFKSFAANPSSTKVSIPLVQTTLHTFESFLSWIPLGYIFETPLLELLSVKLIGNRQLQEGVLSCLSQVASLQLTSEEEARYTKPLCNTFIAIEAALTPVLAKVTSLYYLYNHPILVSLLHYY